MVSFSCEMCNDIVIKKNLNLHRRRCYDAFFTCIDCSTTFSGTDYMSHIQCISEAEKYEKALYKGKPSKANGNTRAQSQAKESASEIVTPVKATDTEKKSKSSDGKVKRDKKAFKSMDLSKYAGGSLKDALKSISKDTKTDKKELMEKLHLELVDGKVVLKL